MTEPREPLICGLEDVEDQDRIWERIAEIFFLSSATQTFGSARDREDFLKRWTGYYRQEEPRSTLLAFSGEETLDCYLTGCRNSAAAERLYADLAYYGLFEDLFAAYPAHFHINCHPRRRALGWGSRLARSFIDICAVQGLAGVHVVTAPEARNAGFYRKLGFDQAVIRPWQDRQLLFLGRKLR